MHDAPATRPTVRLRRHEWDRRMDAEGLSTPDARAGHIGLSRTTVWRVESGHIRPGEEFVAAVLSTFNDAKFEDLFEVVKDPEESL